MTRARSQEGTSRSSRPEPTSHTARTARATRVTLPTEVTFALVLIAGALARPLALLAPFFADDWLFLDQARKRSLLSTLTSPDPIGNFARPLGRQVWFWSVGRLSGESSFIFHLASLAVFLTAVALLFWLARRLAGTGAAAVAASFFALHYAADVPLTWACGSQDLLATTLAVASIFVFTRGRRFAAAGLLLAALLAKESVVLAPLPALLLARRRGEPWRASLVRAWPFALAWLGWAVVVAVGAARGRLHGTGGGFAPDHVLSALVNLARSAVGLEWRTGSLPYLPFRAPSVPIAVSLVIAAAAVLWAGERSLIAARGSAPGPGAKDRPTRSSGDAKPAPAAGPRTAHLSDRDVVWAGLVWAIAAALPVVMAASVWSAYYYLFAMAGVGLALGAMLGRRPVLATAVVVVLTLAGHQARELDEFQTSPQAWSGSSHVNGLYLRRGMSIVSGGLRDLKAAHPTMPHGSTVFLAGLPPFASFQVGDGPLVRGAYRDTSLRAYYLSDFTAERARRGPCYFVFYDKSKGHLVDQGDDPQMLLRIALGQWLSEHRQASLAALDMQLQRHPKDPISLYWAAITAVDNGEQRRADSLFEAAGLHHRGPADAAVAEAQARFRAGDSVAGGRLAIAARDEHVRDAGAHAYLADLYLRYDETITPGVVEAYAAKVLAPGWAPVWRRWGYCQVQGDRQIEGARSLDRYFALDPGARQSDPRAVDIREHLRRTLPGGDLAQAALRKIARPGEH